MVLTAFAGLFLQGYMLKIDSISGSLDYARDLGFSWHLGKHSFKARARVYGTQPFSDEEQETARTNRQAYRDKNPRGVVCGLVDPFTRFVLGSVINEGTSVLIRARDRDGTLVFDVKVGETFLSESMLANGQAKPDIQTQGRDPKISEAAAKGRLSGAGVWHWLPNSVPPRK